MLITKTKSFLENLKALAEEAVLFQVDAAFMKTDPFRKKLATLASKTASFQFDENINHAASGEYTLAIYRQIRGYDESDGECGEDVKSLFTNLLHAARYRRLDTDDLVSGAMRIFDEEVQDEKGEVGDVIERRCGSVPASGIDHM
jgi:hypothetical protein